MTFRFIDQGDALWPGQTQQLTALIGRFRELARLSQRMRTIASVRLLGHARDGPNEDANVLAGETIALRFREVLERQDADCRNIRVESLGSDVPAGRSRRELPKRCVLMDVESLP